MNAISWENIKSIDRNTNSNINYFNSNIKMHIIMKYTM